MNLPAGAGQPVRLLVRARGRFHPSRHDRFLRTAVGRSRREADVAERGLGRLNWAESAPTEVASGRTGVYAKAGFPVRARIGLYRPFPTFLPPLCGALDFSARCTGKQTEGRRHCGP
jgi:hypothetical protein